MNSVPKGSMLGRLDKSFKRISDDAVPKIYRLELGVIEHNPDQPRKTFDPESLEELANSIDKHGLLQPISVRAKENNADEYIIVAGERRYRAHELLGRMEIEAIVTSGDPDELSLIENVQREDLRPLEEARAYQRLMEKHRWTHEQLADAVSKNRTTITKVLTLLNLPEDIQQECDAGESNVSKSMLLEIVASDDEVAQRELWHLARDGNLSIRAAREKKATKPSKGSNSPAPHKSILRACRALSQRMDALPDDVMMVHDIGSLEMLEALRKQIGEAIDQYKNRTRG